MAETVDAEAPDVIIYAAGSNPIVPHIPGFDQPHVHTAHDVLAGKVDLHGSAVVIGGGLVGAETAEHVAMHGCTTTIVEMLPEIAAEMVAAPKTFLMESLKENDVVLCPNTKVLEIGAENVTVESDGVQRAIPADLVILAIGSRSNDALGAHLAQSHAVSIIGDAHMVGKALEGIDEAYRCALSL